MHYLVPIQLEYIYIIICKDESKIIYVNIIYITKMQIHITFTLMTLLTQFIQLQELKYSLG